MEPYQLSRACSLAAALLCVQTSVLGCRAAAAATAAVTCSHLLDALVLHVAGAECKNVTRDICERH